MNKTILILAIAGAFVAGTLSVGSFVLADLDTTVDHTSERDNTTVHSIKLVGTQTMVIIDNAGIGGTSDVEVTWKFDPTKCVLKAAGVGLSGFTTAALANDGAFTGLGIPVAHDDATHLEALLLAAVDDGRCTVSPGKGEFVTASTIGSSGSGILTLTHLITGANPTGVVP